MGKRVNYEDLIIDLYLFNKLEREGANMSTAKYLFLLEENLYDKKIIGPHYKMIKHKMGPYNLKIATNIKNLSLNGYLDSRAQYYDKVSKDVNIYSKNQNTVKFLKSIDDLIQEYSPIFNCLDEIIEEFGSLNAEELKDYIYSLPRAGKDKKKIEDYRMYETIIDPLEIKNPRLSFFLDEDWYDTVEVLLNPQILSGLGKGIEDAKKGRFVFTKKMF